MCKTFTAITGPNIYTEKEILKNKTLIIKNGKIYDIINSSSQKKISANTIELPNSWHLIPGMIDIHIHGANGKDTMDADFAALNTIAKALPQEGVTSFLATTMSSSLDKIEHALNAASHFQKQKNLESEINSAEFLGINLEGPFISKEKAGAQNPKNLIPFDLKLYSKWQKDYDHLIKMVTVAPECISPLSIKKISEDKNTIISLGHSNATYDDAMKAIVKGASHATHLFNGMRTISHHEPGIAFAMLMSDNVSVELIADGIHIHPELFKLIMKVKPLEQIILITDAMRAKGMPAGKYELGGQDVYVKQQKATLANGTLAGSILKMNDALKNFISYTNLPLHAAIKTVTSNPAKKLNIFRKKGSIAINKDADLVILNENLQLITTICKGSITFQR